MLLGTVNFNSNFRSFLVIPCELEILRIVLAYVHVHVFVEMANHVHFIHYRELYERLF